MTYNEEATHVIHANCILCKNNVKKIKDKYAGKLATYMLSYRENGTSHMPHPNFKHHFNSVGYMKCTKTATRVTVIQGQKLPSAGFGNSIKGGINAITPLLRISLYITQKEKLLQSFTDEIELQIENGVKISTSYNNNEGCKAMI